ncbi:MAG: Fic family protein [Acholeplasmataceae bacterium]
MLFNYEPLFLALNKKNIKLTEMGKDLNISSATLAKFAKGQSVSLSLLKQISIYLNISLDDIVKFESINKTSELYERLTVEKNHKIPNGIYHETQIMLTYNSNHIEGSKLSFDQTRYIFETNTIGADQDSSVNVDDVIETKNHFKCIDYMIEHATEPLNEEMIKHIHQILKTNTEDEKISWFKVGEYKMKPNTVGGIETTKPEYVHREIAKLITEYESKTNIVIDDIIEFHYRFECIHPFQDGNGRVGRLIAFKECLRHGLVPFTIDDQIKMFYYRGLSKWKEEKGFLIDTCLRGQDEYKKLLKKFDIKYAE